MVINILILFTTKYFRQFLRCFNCNCVDVIVTKYQAEAQRPGLFLFGQRRPRGHKLGQTEFLVGKLGRAISVLPINHDGDFDFRG
jgi:hypothetical protein